MRTREMRYQCIFEFWDRRDRASTMLNRTRNEDLAGLKKSRRSRCEASHLERRLGQSARVMCARQDEVTGSTSLY